MEANDDPKKYTALIKQCTSVSNTPVLGVVLHSQGGKSQTIGYVTKEVADFEHWPRFGFEQEKDDKGSTVRLAIGKDQPLETVGENIIKLATDESFRAEFPFLEYYPLHKGQKPQVVSLRGVPGKIEIPTGITYVMGAVRHQVHVIPYITDPKEDMKIQVGGGKFSRLSENDGFSNKLSGPVLSGEHAKDICKSLLLTSDLNGKKTLQDCHKQDTIRAHGQVAYRTINEKASFGFDKVVDAAIISCYSVETTDDWMPWFEYKDCKLSSVEDIKGKLLEGKWEPGSALSMIRFLLDKGHISPSCCQDIENSLRPNIPYEGVTTSIP